MMTGWERVTWSEGIPVRAGPLQLGLMDATPETAVFWERLQVEGRLYVKRCAECGCRLHPRKVSCIRCYSWPLEWEPSTGSGQIYTFSVVHHAVDPMVRDLVPYALGLILLDEDVPFFGRIRGKDGSVEGLRVGDRIVAGAEVFVGRLLPVFTVVPESAE